MYDPHRDLVPAVIRAEANARKVNPTGECAMAGGVMYWLLTNGHALGYDYAARKYRYRPVQGNYIPLKPFQPRPAERPRHDRVPFRHQNGTGSVRIA